jgi:hypothetical protein
MAGYLILIECELEQRRRSLKVVIGRQSLSRRGIETEGVPRW